MNGVQALHDGLMDVQKDFASGLSDEITNALTEGASTWQQSLANIGKKMVGLGVNNLMKQAMEGAGLGTGSQAKYSEAQTALDKLSSLTTISTATATINAGVVNVAGMPSGGFSQSVFGGAANANAASTGGFSQSVFGAAANSNTAPAVTALKEAAAAQTKMASEMHSNPFFNPGQSGGLQVPGIGKSFPQAPQLAKQISLSPSFTSSSEPGLFCFVNFVSLL